MPRFEEDRLRVRGQVSAGALASIAAANDAAANADTAAARADSAAARIEGEDGAEATLTRLSRIRQTVENAASEAQDYEVIDPDTGDATPSGIPGAARSADEARAARDEAVQWGEQVPELEAHIARVGRRISEGDDADLTHAFVDAGGKLLASIDRDGRFDFTPTAETANRISHLKADSGEHLVFGVLDAAGRVLLGVRDDGSLISAGSGGAGGVVQDYPLRSPTSQVGISQFVRIAARLSVSTTGQGRTGDPDVAIDGDGLTHPKLLYIPGGWNGYRYWLAATPTFGVTPSAAYENPHVWATNDLTGDWIEPAGGRIDSPEDGNDSYWSDTHLALDDDGWMYLIYRASAFSFASRAIVCRRSRDGVTWSDREVMYIADAQSDLTSSSGLLSPAIFQTGSRWRWIDIIRDTPSFPVPGVDYADTRAVFQRSSSHVAHGYGDYDTSQIVNYSPRAWGEGLEPWHIDAITVGNLHLHLINVGPSGGSTGSRLYLAWSSDGWSFSVLPELNALVPNCYRSSLSVREARDGHIALDVIVARTDGSLDLYDLHLEIK